MLVLTFNKISISKVLLLISFGFSTLSYGDTSQQNSPLTTSSSDTPKRVAALSWELVESVIELGVTPVAISDIKGYREWVRVPSIPVETQDI
jgi:iron complex transport system substrate-binding protein